MLQYLKRIVAIICKQRCPKARMTVVPTVRGDEDTGSGRFPPRCRGFGLSQPCLPAVLPPPAAPPALLPPDVMLLRATNGERERDRCE